MTQPGGNMEGKEVRFGIANSALFHRTTDASCGAVNGMHDSYTPLGGMVPLVNIMLGEIVFGGVGAGMYGILIFVINSPTPLPIFCLLRSRKSPESGDSGQNQRTICDLQTVWRRVQSAANPSFGQNSC
jgi:uncharacterized membrane protein